MEEFGYLLGQGRGNAYKTKAGVTIGPSRALGITAWYSGVRFIAEVVASLPVHTYQDRNGERVRRADPPWMSNPDVDQTWFGLVEFWMMSKLHKGNSFTFKLRNNVGQVVGLREIHPDRLTTGIAPDGSKRFVVDNGDTVYTTRDILHIPGLSWDGRFGMNPIQYAADALGGVAAADDYSQRFYSSGAHMGGIISMPDRLTSEQAVALKGQWDAFHEGILNAHKTGVLSGGAQYNRISLSADDAQLIEARQYGVAEVARLLRLPPHKLYELSRSTNNNIEHQSIEAITDGIQPWLDRIEAWINADRDLLPEGNFIEFVIEGRLRGDTATRYAAHASATGRPWKTPNEARKIENLPPVDGGDELLMPLNMGTAAALGTEALGGDPT
jgi:HK97 family phage portal protein